MSSYTKYPDKYYRVYFFDTWMNYFETFEYRRYSDLMTKVLNLQSGVELRDFSEKGAAYTTYQDKAIYVTGG